MSRESVTKEVRALLDSTPRGLTTREIENDYRNFCSGNLAAVCHRIGYPSTSTFLYHLVDNGSLKCENGLFKAGIGDSSTAHIQKLVSKQMTKTDRRGRNRNSAPSSRFSGGSAVRQNTPIKSLPLKIQNNILDVVRTNGGKMSLSNLLSRYKNQHGAEFNFRGFNFSTLKEAVASISYINLMEENFHTVIELQRTSQPHTGAVNSTLEDLKSNIRKVLSSCPPTGIYMTRFASEYRKITSKTLNPHQYGYSTIIELMDSLSDVVDMVRHASGDWVISDIKNHRPESEDRREKNSQRSPIISNIEQLIFSQPDGVYLVRFHQLYKMKFGEDLNIAQLGYSDISTLVRELDNVDIVNAKYGALVRRKSDDEPEDVDSYYSLMGSPTDFVGVEGRYTLSPLPPIGQPVSVKLSHIYNPNHFYIQIMRSSNTGNALEELMDKLDRCYTPLERSSDTEAKLPTDLCTVGQVCVCRYPIDNNWHRAVIISVLNSTQVRVQFVDYGTRCTIDKTKLYLLRYAYLEFPALSQRASLHGVQPRDSSWTPAAGKALLNMTADANVEGILRKKERQDDDTNILIISLQTWMFQVRIDVAEFLVTSQVAQATNQTKLSESTDLEKLEKMIDWGSDSSSGEDEVYSPIGTQKLHQIPSTKQSEPMKLQYDHVTPPTNQTGPIQPQDSDQVAPSDQSEPIISNTHDSLHMNQTESIKSPNINIDPPAGSSKPTTAQNTSTVIKQQTTDVTCSSIEFSSQTSTPSTPNNQQIETQLTSTDSADPPPLESSCGSSPQASQYQAIYDITTVPQNSPVTAQNEQSNIDDQPPPLSLHNKFEATITQSTLNHESPEFIPSLIPATSLHDRIYEQAVASHRINPPQQQYAEPTPQYPTFQEQYKSSQLQYSISQPYLNYHQSYGLCPPYQHAPLYGPPMMVPQQPTLYSQSNFVPVPQVVPYTQPPISQYQPNRMRRPAFMRQPAPQHNMPSHSAFRPISPRPVTHTVPKSQSIMNLVPEENTASSKRSPVGKTAPSQHSPIGVIESLKITIKNDQYCPVSNLSSDDHESESREIVQETVNPLISNDNLSEISDREPDGPPPLVTTDDHELLIILREQLARLYLLKKRRELRREQRLSAVNSLSGCEGSSSDEDLIFDSTADNDLMNKIEDLQQQIGDIQSKIKERIYKTDSIKGLQQIIQTKTQARGRGRLLKFLNEVQSAN